MSPAFQAGDESRRKKVLVVGAGAAGMSCAYHLAQSPENFDVTLIDAVDYCGGQAFSIPLDKDRHGAGWLNQGVQGGSYIFHHTMTMFARQGFHADPVNLQVSFGKGDTFWTNKFPTKLLASHQKEVRRFHTMLKITRRLELVFALLPMWLTLKLFWFSRLFANTVAMPMVALFLGTGNYTPSVPTIMLERLCTSPTYGMWYPADPLSVASNLPPMVVFPNLSEFYKTWKQDLEKKGVRVRLSTELVRVVRRTKAGVTVILASRSPVKNGHNPLSAAAAGNNAFDTVTDAKEEMEAEYDELVLCVLADTAKRVLAKTADFRDRRVLGSAKFSDDITVTHNDANYMRKHYENFYNPNQAVSSLSGIDQSARIAEAKKTFQPMYYIKMYPTDMTKLEMSFDCTNYQGQFPHEVPFDDHIFQTIYLNKARDSKHWDIDEIDDAKIVRKDWWHQLCHSFTHYLFVVPWMWLLQGRKSTRFAASWTLVNAHEVAVISGIAAAVNLGAPYPEDLERDPFALLSFRLYYLLIYGRWYRRRIAKASSSDLVTGQYGHIYKGPGVSEQERMMWREDQARER